MVVRQISSALVLGALAAGTLGCQTFSTPKLPQVGLPKVPNPLASRDDVEEAEKVVEVAAYNPNKKKGLIHRVLPTDAFEPASLYKTRATPQEAIDRLEAAKGLLAAGEHEEAAREFEDIRRKHGRTSIEEEATFLVAEAHFAGRDFPKASDAYERLFERFPSTRFADTSTERLYAIAQHWIGAADPITAGDIQTVGFERPTLATTSPGPSFGFSPSRSLPFVPNWFDRSRPTFDTTGRGLQALRSIWLNDPNGDLADDALMAIASHYVRNGNDLEADRYLTIIRNDYPDSPYLEDAFVVGGHVKQVSYQGVEYDATSLEDAAKLKKQALRLFPGTPDRDRLVREIDEAGKQAAARQWAMVEFYERKKLPRSVAVAAHALLTDYPTSEYAPRARAVFDALPAETKAILPPLPDALGRPTPAAEPDPGTIRDSYVVPAAKEQAGRASL